MKDCCLPGQCRYGIGVGICVLYVPGIAGTAADDGRVKSHKHGAVADHQLKTFGAALRKIRSVDGNRIVDGDGITILDFQDSSTNVVITYTVERAVLGDSAGTVRVEVQEDRGSVWMEVRWDAVSGGVTNTVTIPGFWIGRDTRWRVRLEADQ